MRTATLIISDEEGNTSEYSRPPSSVYSTLESNPDIENNFKSQVHIHVHGKRSKASTRSDAATTTTTSTTTTPSTEVIDNAKDLQQQKEQEDLCDNANSLNMAQCKQIVDEDITNLTSIYSATVIAETESATVYNE